MLSTPLLSVIIPIYNVEEYLRECLESVINQTYQNLEIILVNDGSPDNSEQICQEYVEKDTRVKYYKKENGGLSSARNFGIDRVTGDYIAFVDSDDFLELDIYQKCFDKIQSIPDYTSRDVICFRIQSIDLKGNIISTWGKDLDIVVDTKLMLNQVAQRNILSPHNAVIKVYSKELLQSTRFIENVLVEDLPFFLELLPQIKRLFFIPDIGYNYRNNPNSIMNNQGYLKLLNNFRNGFNIIKRNVDLETERIFNTYIFHNLYHYEKQIDNDKELAKVYHMFRKEIAKKGVISFSKKEAINNYLKLNYYSLFQLKNRIIERIQRT